MKGCTYVGALSTGHICYPPSALTAGSPNVRVNFVLAGRLGDLFAPHACPCANCPPPHAVRPISQGPANVYFNFRPPGRIGDLIGCGDTIAQGSFNVFAGTF
jgi:uncharacterized Zn-binding protein involved in type VI secretion